MKRLIIATLAVASLVGVAACGSDNDSKLTDVGNATDDSAADDNGNGDNGNGSVPVLPGVPEQCQAIMQAIGGAGAAMAGQSDIEQAKAVFASLETVVPDDLKDDARIFAEAYGAYIELLAQFEGDASQAMTNPDVVAALSALSSPEVAAAAGNLSAYMDATCPN